MTSDVVAIVVGGAAGGSVILVQIVVSGETGISSSSSSSRCWDMVVGLGWVRLGGNGEDRVWTRACSQTQYVDGQRCVMIIE